LPAHLGTRLKGAPSSFRATRDVVLSAWRVAATALLQKPTKGSKDADFYLDNFERENKEISP